jgi:predicted GIY-YIG superfamily endonuclease
MDLSLPPSPGIYRFYNGANQLIYVGKAKNLRRRLAQYKNAKRCKAHAKMRKIIREAKRLEHEVCADEFQALCLETQWIQKHRPKWNVVGAFFFLYPMVGLRAEGGHLYLCYTTTPERYAAFQFHGSFRSRERTRDAFFALVELLSLVGHSIPKAQLVKSGILPTVNLDLPDANDGEQNDAEQIATGAEELIVATITSKIPQGKKTPRSKRPGYVYGFRQLPADWEARFNAFLRGEDFGAIEELALLLLDRPTAIKKSKETQESLHLIRRFWRHEILPLRRACKQSQWKDYPVTQRDRDLLFIALRGKQSLSDQESS